MQKKRILRLCCAVLMVSLSACEYEDDFPAGVGEGNIEAIVLNEGRIGTNMGAISVLYRNGMVSPDVFRVVNNRPLGDPRNKRQKATKKCQSLVNHRVYKTFFFYPRQFLTE